MDELIKKLRMYADTYKKEPAGREVEGTVELLENSADALQEAGEAVQKLKQRFVDGIDVHYQGHDADDYIECPFCGYEVAAIDDYC